MGNVYNHEVGKRHVNNLTQSSNEGTKSNTDASNVDLAPGEPVPPGLETDVLRTTKIQVRKEQMFVNKHEFFK